MEAREESQRVDITSELISTMRREELEFMLKVMTKSGSLNSYFAYENGLIHRLGVIRFDNETNPVVPLIRTEAIINFTQCEFDSFELVPMIASFHKCKFKSFHGFHRHASSFSKYSSNILPKTLWDLEYDGDFESPYIWNESSVLMPSTGSKWPSVDLDRRLNENPQMRDLHSSFNRFSSSPTLILGFEKIWLRLMIETEMDLFAELYHDVIDEHRQRIIGILGVSESDLDLKIRAG